MATIYLIKLPEQAEVPTLRQLHCPYRERMTQVQFQSLLLLSAALRSDAAGLKGDCYTEDAARILGIKL